MLWRKERKARAQVVDHLAGSVDENLKVHAGVGGREREGACFLLVSGCTVINVSVPPTALRPFQLDLWEGYRSWWCFDNVALIFQLNNRAHQPVSELSTAASSAAQTKESGYIQHHWFLHLASVLHKKLCKAKWHKHCRCKYIQWPIITLNHLR